MIIKAHHCFTDGLGLSTMFLALSDGYDADNLLRIVPPHWCLEMLAWMMTPLLAVYTLKSLAYKSDNIHALKHDLTDC
jgi:hypothetical protein